MTKFPSLVKVAKTLKHPDVPPIMRPAPYEQVVGYDRLDVH